MIAPVRYDEQHRELVVLARTARIDTARVLVALRGGEPDAVLGWAVYVPENMRLAVALLVEVLDLVSACLGWQVSTPAETTWRAWNLSYPPFMRNDRGALSELKADCAQALPLLFRVVDVRI